MPRIVQARKCILRYRRIRLVVLVLLTVQCACITGWWMWSNKHEPSITVWISHAVNCYDASATREAFRNCVRQITPSRFIQPLVLVCGSSWVAFMGLLSLCLFDVYLISYYPKRNLLHPRPSPPRMASQAPSILALNRRIKTTRSDIGYIKINPHPPGVHSQSVRPKTAKDRSRSNDYHSIDTTYPINAVPIDRKQPSHPAIQPLERQIRRPPSIIPHHLTRLPTSITPPSLYALAHLPPHCRIPPHRIPCLVRFKSMPLGTAIGPTPVPAK
jgi:hypothetical protein